MLESIISLIIVATLLFGTPGPAPLALAAVSATYGAKKGVPFFCGIICGLAVALVGSVVGVAALFSAFPKIRFVVQLIGAIYIIYIALKIAKAPLIDVNVQQQKKVPGFIEGFILNILNPKAYAAFLALFAQFLVPLSNETVSYIVTGLILFCVATVVDVIWLLVGEALRPMFESPTSARVLRMTFAILMIAAVTITIFIEI